MQTRRLHVVQVIASLDNEAAGTTPWLHRLVDELRSSDVDCDVLALSLKADIGHATPGFSVHAPDRCRFPGFNTLLGSRSLKQAIMTAAERGHILHSSGLWRMPNVYAGWAAARTGCPLVISPHGMLGPSALKFSARKKQIFGLLVQHRALAAVTCFHATSQKEVEDIRAYGLKAPIALIANAIDVPEARLGSVDGIQTQTARRTLLYLGRLHRIKRIDALISAWAQICDRFPQWELRIVGPSDGGYVNELQEQTRRLGISSVHFGEALYGEAKLEAYRSADLFVLPTSTENFGMVVAESLASGTPVISTKGAPWEGLVTHGCGWWIDHGVDPMVAALQEAMALPRAELKRMGALGRDWMRYDFSWDRIAADMIELYRWCQTKVDPPSFMITD